MSTDSIQFQNMLREYLQLQTQNREIEMMLGKYKLHLNSVFEKAGVDVVNTPMGRLKRIKSETGVLSFTLELGDVRTS